MKNKFLKINRDYRGVSTDNIELVKTVIVPLIESKLIISYILDETLTTYTSHGFALHIQNALYSEDVKAILKKCKVKVVVDGHDGYINIYLIDSDNVTDMVTLWYHGLDKKVIDYDIL